MKSESKFADCHDLGRLKYFDENKNGQLALRPEEAERIIDFHTHLGITFLMAPRLNLFRKTTNVDYFFPYRGAPIDMDVYSGYCIDNDIRNTIAVEYIKTAYSANGFVRSQTVPNILADMDRMRITHSVSLALDYPWGISNCSDMYLKHLKHEPRIICYACVHPYSMNRKQKVNRFIDNGAFGIKLHPAQLFYRANNPRLNDIYEACQERRVPVLFHSGASPVAPKWQEDLPSIKHFPEPVKNFPELIFIFGHAGIEEYQMVIELGKKHDNVYMESSGQPPHRIKEMVDGIGSERVLYGSDWPFYPFEFPLTKALMATEGDPGLREKVLYKNAKRLLKEYGGREI